MRIVDVAPETFQRALDKCRPGDVIRLGKGVYSEIYKLKRKRGKADTPIVIEADPALERGAVKISQEMDAEIFRPIANKIARERYEDGEYPGLWAVARDARFRIRKCKYVTIRNLDFEESWPTHINIHKSNHVLLENCHFLDGTFCIVASGRRTSDVTVDGCTWTQDRVPDRIWSGISWKRIHGHPEHDGCPWAVREDDYRLFDGDFFRANGIRGRATIRNCQVKNAFNGVHAEGDGNNQKTNCDFHVHNCHFIQIRDNAIEPEQNAYNWFVHDNVFIDNHAPFSFSCKDMSFVFIFSNLIAFRTIQGTSGPDLKDRDCNRGGKVFKIKANPRKPHGPNYVFHNSIITRLKYLPKGIFEGLKHFNNAVHFVPMAGANFDQYPSYFGKLTGNAPGDRFTSDWSGPEGYAIEMNGDVVKLQDWPTKHREAGYDIGPDSNGTDPGFARTDFSQADPEFADFATVTGGPCDGKGIGFQVELPNGQLHDVGAGHDIGAVQRDNQTGALRLFEGPQFQTVNLSGFV